MIDDIRELLDAPRPADAMPFLERVDSTLTAGYAHALQLEAERWRLERRIGELAATLVDDSGGFNTEELAELSRRLTATNESIVSLRTLLTSLRARRSALRTAA